MHYHIYSNIRSLGENHRASITEFEKRLSAYCETTLHTDSALTFPKAFAKSGHRFLLIQPRTSTLSSTEFSQFLKEQQMEGLHTIHVIIGFTDEAFYAAWNQITASNTPVILSLTACRLSAQTLTLLFYEQLYRGYTILQGKTYHK